MIPTGTPQLMKRINRSLLLEAIWSHGPISRADLAKEMKLSPATVSAITDQLLQDGFVIEHGIGESQGGRPPILLTFRPEARHVVAVSVSVDGIQAALMNLDTTVLHEVQHPIDLSSGDALIASIRLAVQALLSTSSHPINPILGVGIACPGLIDSRGGVLRYSSSLGQANVALAAPLQQAFGFPVLVDNDQNVVALAELLQGAGHGYQDLIYVSVESGIGAGIVTDGRIYRGTEGGAGELGHTTIDLNGPQCKCGNRGCLGVMAGGMGMAARAVHLVQQRAATVLNDYCAGDIGQLRPGHVVAAAQAHDRLASAIFVEAMNYLGAAIANLINLFAPELVILGGSIVRQAGEMLFRALNEAIAFRALPANRDNVRLTPALVGPQSGVIGAGLLVIQNFRTTDAFAG